MKRFCPNCGAEVEEGTVFCGNCGGRVPEEETPVTPAPGGFDNSAFGTASASPAGNVLNKLPSNLNLKLIGIAGGAVVALIVIVILISVIVSNTGSKGFLKKTMKAIINTDTETLVNITSDVALDYLDEMGIDSDDYEELIEESIGSGITDVFEDKVGHKYKTSYKIVEIYTASDRQLDKTLDNYILTSDEDFREDAEDAIDEMVIAEVEITAKQDKKSKTIDGTVYMTKENGKWMLFASEFN